MNEQKKKYKESLKNTPGSIKLSECKSMKMDLNGIAEYAKKKGVQPIDLSEEEKAQFIREDEDTLDEAYYEYLRKIVQDVKNGTAHFVEHDLIEVDDD